jgi:hypothetical protein
MRAHRRYHRRRTRCYGGTDSPVPTSCGSSGGEDAEVAGTVILEDQCLPLEFEARYPVMWPPGTRLQPERPWELVACAVPIGGQGLSGWPLPPG